LAAAREGYVSKAKSGREALEEAARKRFVRSLPAGLSSELGKLVDYVVRDYVTFWYEMISDDDDAFVRDTRAHLAQVLAEFGSRCVERLNLVAFSLDTAADAATLQLRAHGEARAAAARKRRDLFDKRKNESPEELVAAAKRRNAATLDELAERGKLHPALTWSSYYYDNDQGGGDRDDRGDRDDLAPSERRYLRHTAAKVVRLVAPASDVNCRAVRHLLREVLSNAILGTALASIKPENVVHWIAYALSREKNSDDSSRGGDDDQTTRGQDAPPDAATSTSREHQQRDVVVGDPQRERLTDAGPSGVPPSSSSSSSALKKKKKKSKSATPEPPLEEEKKTIRPGAPPEGFDASPAWRYFCGAADAASAGEHLQGRSDGAYLLRVDPSTGAESRAPNEPIELTLSYVVRDKGDVCHVVLFGEPTSDGGRQSFEYVRFGGGKRDPRLVDRANQLADSPSAPTLDGLLEAHFRDVAFDGISFFNDDKDKGKDVVRRRHRSVDNSSQQQQQQQQQKRQQQEAPPVVPPPPAPTSSQAKDSAAAAAAAAAVSKEDSAAAAAAAKEEEDSDAAAAAAAAKAKAKEESSAEKKNNEEEEEIRKATPMPHEQVADTEALFAEQARHVLLIELQAAIEMAEDLAASLTVQIEKVTAKAKKLPLPTISVEKYVLSKDAVERSRRKKERDLQNQVDALRRAKWRDGDGARTVHRLVKALDACLAHGAAPPKVATAAAKEEDDADGVPPLPLDTQEMAQRAPYCAYFLEAKGRSSVMEDDWSSSVPLPSKAVEAAADEGDPEEDDRWVELRRTAAGVAWIVRGLMTRSLHAAVYDALAETALTKDYFSPDAILREPSDTARLLWFAERVDVLAVQPPLATLREHEPVFYAYCMFGDTFAPYLKQDSSLCAGTTTKGACDNAANNATTNNNGSAASGTTTSYRDDAADSAADDNTASPTDRAASLTKPTHSLDASSSVSILSLARAAISSTTTNAEGSSSTNLGGGRDRQQVSPRSKKKGKPGTRLGHPDDDMVFRGRAAAYRASSMESQAREPRATAHMRLQYLLKRRPARDALQTRGIIPRRTVANAQGAKILADADGPKRQSTMSSAGTALVDAVSAFYHLSSSAASSSSSAAVPNSSSSSERHVLGGGGHGATVSQNVPAFAGASVHHQSHTNTNTNTNNTNGGAAPSSSSSNGGTVTPQSQHPQAAALSLSLMSSSPSGEVVPPSPSKYSLLHDQTRYYRVFLLAPTRGGPELPIVVPVSKRRAYARRRYRDFRALRLALAAATSKRLPKLPPRRVAERLYARGKSSLEARRAGLETFLVKLLQDPIFRDSHEVRAFVFDSGPEMRTVLRASHSANPRQDDDDVLPFQGAGNDEDDDDLEDDDLEDEDDELLDEDDDDGQVDLGGSYRLGQDQDDQDDDDVLVDEPRRGSAHTNGTPPPPPELASRASSAALSSSSPDGNNATFGFPPRTVPSPVGETTTNKNDDDEDSSMAAATTTPTQTTSQADWRRLKRVEHRTYMLLRELFDVDHMGLMRRNFVALLRRGARALWSPAMATWLGERTVEAARVKIWTNLAKRLNDLVWPDGEMRDAAEPDDDLARAEHIRAAAELRDTLAAAIPASLASLVGSAAADDAVVKLHDLLLCPIQLRSLAYTLFDLMLVEVFPELELAIGGLDHLVV